MLAGYLLIRLRRKARFLTKEEMREFYDGVKVVSGNGHPPELNADENAYLRKNFDRSFELAVTDYNLDNCPILGTGNFGMAYKTNVRGTPVAVKVPHDNCSKEAFKSMLCEVKILVYLGKHPNLVGFVGCYTRAIERGVIHIVTELCERGSLQGYLRKKLGMGDRETSDGETVRLLQELMEFSFEIASGMEYISGQKVIHGDLSTRNVLLDGDMTCKIGDFGLSRKLYEYTKYTKSSQEPLPWRWMAYESLVKMEFNTKSDVWSYGVTLWEIFSLGAIPYPGLGWTADFADDLRKGFRMRSPQFATEPIFNKLESCWNLDSESRPNFKELREFFLQLRNQLYYSEL